MCSKCEAIEDVNIDCTGVAHVSTFTTVPHRKVYCVPAAVKNIGGYDLCYFIKLWWIRYRVCGEGFWNELDTVYLTALFELNLFNQIR
jgi:hypothetical protein